MRMKDAIASLQLGKKKQTVVHRLCTDWSRQAKDGPQAVPLSEYPRPQLRRADWRCLNGWWEYSIRPAGEPMGEAEGHILVPFSPETERSGVGRTLQPGEALWYRRQIEGIQLLKGRRLLLHFGAVDERCTVWWNGQKVGRHRNGYLAFSFDVTKYVRPEGNLLEVCVRDDTDKGNACRGKQTLEPGGMYYHAQSGIWQTVWLETVPDNYLRALKITPLPEEEAVELEMTFTGGSEDESTGRSAGGLSDRSAGRSAGGLSDRSADGSADESVPETEAQSAALPEGKVRITVCEPSVQHMDETPDGSGNIRTGELSAEGLSAEGLLVEGLSAAELSAAELQKKPKEAAKEKGNPGAGTFLFDRKNKMKVRIPIPAPGLWSPEHPVLYTLRIETGEDAVESYFGMRSFGVGEDGEGRPCLLLNGEPYFFHGVLDQGYWPESLMTAPADEALVHDIVQMKEAGFNMIRKHVKIEAARWYYHCDRIGMVVWQDMVNGGGPVRKLLETYLPTIFPALGTHVRDNQYRLLARGDKKARDRFEKDLVRMVRQLYSFPCIAMWVLFNEGWGQFDALRLTEILKKEDPTRPVDHASGWFDQGGGDVRSVHNYFRPLTVERERRPFVLSEYGGANCTIAGHAMNGDVYGYQTVAEEAFPRTFRELMEKIFALSKEGMAGAVYTQVSDIEEETNGLMTYDRKVNKLTGSHSAEEA